LRVGVLLLLAGSIGAGCSTVGALGGAVLGGDVLSGLKAGALLGGIGWGSTMIAIAFIMGARNLRADEEE
jgi:hypothetical protein